MSILPVEEVGSNSHEALALLLIGVFEGIIAVDIDASDDRVVTALKGVSVSDNILEEETCTNPFPGVKIALETP
jgi:hypothetical protein